MRFDEVELDAVPVADVAESPSPARGVSRWRRLLALFTDLSLFAALALALSPLLPQPAQWMFVAALAGFVVMLSYYYFVGAWMLWGKTIGGAIFDVRVSESAMTLRDASLRWLMIIATVSACAAAVALYWMS